MTSISLVERRFVDREADPTDRRRNTVRITKAGLRHLHRLDRVIAVAQAELLAPLSAAERQQFVRLLTRLVQHHAPPA